MLEDLVYRFLTLAIAVLFGLLVGLILTPFLRWTQNKRKYEQEKAAKMGRKAHQGKP